MRSAVVGTYVHTSDISSPAPYRRQIPPLRASQDHPSGASGTPIYDSLYSEYRRLFRTLPGDRSGEESPHLNAFASGQDEDSPYRLGRHRGNRGTGPAALPPGSGDNRMHGL